MLPESPLTLIARLRHMVVGYPERIAVEFGRVEITLLELGRGVDDGTDAIVRLQAEEEDGQLGIERPLLQAGGGFLHIDDGREVAFLQRHMANEEIGLHDGVGGRVVEVIGSADEAVFACRCKVPVEAGVLVVAALGSLDEDEADGNGSLL